MKEPSTDSFPTRWKRLRLKNLVDGVRNGTWGEEPSSEDDGVVCIRAADFDRERLRVSQEKLVRRALTQRELQLHLLEQGDVVLEKSGGGDEQPVGAAVLFDLPFLAVATNFAARVRPAAGIDPRYLCYVLAATYYLGINERSIKQTTGIQNLDSASFFNEPWAAPKLEEQRAIADFLDHETARIDALVAKTNALCGQIIELRQTVIFRGVSGLLGNCRDVHDPGLPWTRTVRKPWPRVKIKHVAELGTGHTPSRLHPEYWESCTIPWITTGEIAQVRDDRAEVITKTREKISELGLANSAAALHPKGTVVLCRTASAGYSAIMGDDMATSQDFVTWTCSDDVLPRYLLMCLRAMRSDLLGRLAYGSTHKTIYFPDVEDLVIPLPSVGEQRELLKNVEACLKPIDVMGDRLSKRNELLIERRHTLITASVTGRMFPA